jgi:hypothetical protein
MQHVGKCHKNLRLGLCLQHAAMAKGPGQNAAATRPCSALISNHQLIRKQIQYQFSGGDDLFIYLIIMINSYFRTGS